MQGSGQLSESQRNVLPTASAVSARIRESSSPGLELRPPTAPSGCDVAIARAGAVEPGLELAVHEGHHLIYGFGSGPAAG